MHPAVVLVHYRHAHLTSRCIDSLLKHCPDIKYLIVVDNSPNDGSLNVLKSQFDDSRLIWLPMPGNLGFGAGCNAGIATARQLGVMAVLLLNNDTWVETDVISAFVAASRRYRQRALLTGCIVEPDGRLWYAGGNYCLNTVRTRHWQQPLRHERSVPFISGCLLWLPQIALDRLQGFDPDYFLYLEDLDLSLRAQQAGIPMVCLPEVRVIHAPSSTTGQNQALPVYYQNRNRWRLLMSHGKGYNWLCFLPFYLLGLLRRLLNPQLRRPSLEALRDALCQRWGIKSG